jgi:hypothetical protein
MARIAQLGIAIGLLGIIMVLMGLFPGVTGLEPTAGIGILQIMMWLVGFSLLVLGALIYVKFTLYLNKPSTLWQSIGVRLGLTGIVFAAISGLADVVGFGSNMRVAGGDILLGPLQAFGILGSFTLSAVGVALYALTGNPDAPSEAEDAVSDDTMVKRPD